LLVNYGAGVPGDQQGDKAMPTMPIAKAADGFYHPASEADVIALVNHARANGQQVRARGATHSVALSVYTDPVDGKPVNKTLERHPPAGRNIDLALDRMMALTWIDQARGIVEAEAGIHLGFDPSDPFRASTLANSFLHQVFLKGWALNILGGITHQTIGGFTAMGSAGGSIQYAYDNIVAFRVVDGLGVASWIEAGEPAFDAMLTSVGLLGVVTAMRFQLIPMYNIAGTEVTTGVGSDCPIDLYGPGDATRPSLQKFLTDTPYSRMTWWPQKGCERVQIWQANRVPASDNGLVPYQEFTPDLGGQAKQLMASLFFVLLGNRNLGRIFKLLFKNVSQFRGNVTGIWSSGMLGAAGALLAWIPAVIAALVLVLAGLVLGIIPGTMRYLFTTILPMFNPITKASAPTRFSDWYWRSLCMDNTADDVLLGTEFVEIWLPIQYTAQVMTLLQAMFDAHGSAATGYFALEIYAAAPSPAWINPSYSDGTDMYKDGVSRFDVYWYRDNEGTPNHAHDFFTQYWNLLRTNGIPFRFHWGKFIPFYDFPNWAAYYAENLPRLGDFLALRGQRDPTGVFFTEYWQLRLLGKLAGGQA
jgi:D-arabinono-1,4-lactone oxidase